MRYAVFFNGSALVVGVGPPRGLVHHLVMHL